MKFIPSLSSFPSWARSAKTYIVGHKIISGIALVVIVVAGYSAYHSLAKAAVPTKYVVQDVRTGTVASTVSGTGQVSASNQVSLTPKASGEITAIRVKPGQQVAKGQVIASVDLGTAGTDLETAELQLKQAEASNSTTLTSSAESATKAQSDLTSAQENALNTLTSSFGSLDQVIVDLGDLYNSAGYLHANAGDANLRAYQNAGSEAYGDAQIALKSAETQASSVNRESTDTNIQSALTAAYNAAKLVSKASALSQTAVQYARTQKDTTGASTQSNTNAQAVANAAWNTVSSDVSNSNSQVTSLLSASQNITDAENAITDANTKVTDVTSGSGALDIRSAQLNVQAKQQAYDDHFVTAPFTGVIATVTGNVGDQGSSGTAIATLVTTQELASITLNEVDVTDVRAGQKATLTFDAITGLTLPGTVAEVDGIGTVSQGVVSYGVKIALDKQDDRIKPGMTVSADIQTAEVQNVLVVPSAAIKTLNGRSYVQAFSPALVVTSTSSQITGIATEQKPTRISVKTGITDGTRTEITSGLTEGQQIIVRTVTGTTAAATTKTSAAAATTRTGGGGGFGGGGGARIP